MTMSDEVRGSGTASTRPIFFARSCYGRAGGGSAAPPREKAAHEERHPTLAAAAGGSGGSEKRVAKLVGRLGRVGG